MSRCVTQSLKDGIGISNPLMNLKSSPINIVRLYSKILHLTREFHIKLHGKTDISHKSRSDESDISVFQETFNVEFPRQVANFP